MKDQVAVLGCGPAGLLAAEAAHQAGYEVVIYSKKVKSEISGAQFLHKDILGFGLDSEECKISKIGTKSGYAMKLYGRTDAPCSWSRYEEGMIDIWSLRDLYERLWIRHNHKIIETDVHLGMVEGMVKQNYRLVVSSIPLPILCPSGFFTSQEVDIISFKIEDGQKEFIGEDNWICWMGSVKYPVYRMSSIFGYYGAEYPIGRSGEHQNAVIETLPYEIRPVTVTKPLQCSSVRLPGVMRVGRYGKWDKSVLAHEAFFEVKKELEK